MFETKQVHLYCWQNWDMTWEKYTMNVINIFKIWHHSVDIKHKNQLKYKENGEKNKMKKRKIATILAGLALVAILAACGSNKAPITDGNNSGISNPPLTENGDNEAVMLASYKSAAVSKLDEIVNPLIVEISDESLKSAIQSYYDSEKQYINGITDLETAKNAATKVVEDTKVL